MLACRPHAREIRRLDSTETPGTYPSFPLAYLYLASHRFFLGPGNPPLRYLYHSSFQQLFRLCIRLFLPLYGQH